jgi:SET domain-containing protein
MNQWQPSFTQVKGIPKPFLNFSLGRGVFTKRSFCKGEFLLEYKGELVSKKEGCSREDTYPADVGSYLFFFQHGNKSLW